MSVRYSWTPGSRFSGDVTKVGRELERIRKAEAGRLEPEAVVAQARSANSSLHAHFEWDDGKAAHAHRLDQAGSLIRAVSVDVTHSNIEAPKTVRAFVSVERPSIGNPGVRERSYTSTVDALSDADLRAQVLATAWRELLAIREKYAGLEILAKIFAAIDEARPR